MTKKKIPQPEHSIQHTREQSVHKPIESFTVNREEGDYYDGKIEGRPPRNLLLVGGRAHHERVPSSPPPRGDRRPREGDGGHRGPEGPGAAAAAATGAAAEAEAEGTRRTPW